MRLAPLKELKERLAELEEERRAADEAGDMREELRLWEACHRVKARIEEIERGG
jgi:hypothetical protein